MKLTKTEQAAAWRAQAQQTIERAVKQADIKALYWRSKADQALTSVIHIESHALALREGLGELDGSVTCGQVLARIKKADALDLKAKELRQKAATWKQKAIDAVARARAIAEVSASYWTQKAAHLENL